MEMSVVAPRNVPCCFILTNIYFNYKQQKKYHNCNRMSTKQHTTRTRKATANYKLWLKLSV